MRVCMAGIALLALASASVEAGPLAKPELVGAPTRYMIEIERLHSPAPDTDNFAFYPIPRESVTRDTYMKCIDEMDPAGLAERPAHGLNGPTAFLPVLAKYVQTGEAGWAKAIVAMLGYFHEAMREEVARKGWVEQFEFPAAYLPIYRKHLIEGGAMKPDTAWFRELYLYYCRHLHVWGEEPIEWRGGCHRSTPEAMSKGLAAQWYPDIPEAAHWKDYSNWVFRDFWTHKDHPQNDTGYTMPMLTPYLCSGDQWLGDDRVYTDPGMQRVWERLLLEVSPDGAINPFGPNGGWNSTGFKRIYMLERLAAKTGDGRYRFVGHKVFNYIRYQLYGADMNSYRIPGEYTALAWLFTDESIEPVQPASGSLWTTRLEAVRVPHTDKEVTERLLGNADPDPLKGHICCSYYITGKEWPNKFLFRAGWNPGDFFGIVELHPTSFPANPGGIIGLNRWGAPFTQVVTSKGASVENRLMVVDVDKTATRRYHRNPLRINEHWRKGAMPDIRSEVTLFEDTSEATYASVRVQNVDGLPVVYDREFIFVKRGVLATREIITFEESFRAQVAPTWNTHNVGPQIGPHWANTFIGAPVGDNGSRAMRTPPVDLLVWFAPRDDCRLQVVDRIGDDPRAVDCPNQLRYLWEGMAEAGRQLVFTQVYYPHQPYRPLRSSADPLSGQKVEYGNALKDTAGAAGITVLRDDVEASILRLEMEPGRVEWLVFNPRQMPLQAGGSETRRPFAYVAQAGL